MTLEETITAVNEKILDKDTLVSYDTAISTLRARMLLASAELEKKEAVYMVTNPDLSVADRKVNWKATTDGLKLIELKRKLPATKTLLESIKTRLYQTY